MTYINRIYFCRSILKHTVCKTSCRRPNIHTHLAAKLHLKLFNCFFKLETAAANIFECISSDLQSRFFYIKHGACFIFFLAIDVHTPRHNDCLCFLARFGKSPPYQQHIQAFLHIQRNPPYCLFSQIVKILSITVPASIPTSRRSISTLPCSTYSSGM